MRQEGGEEVSEIRGLSLTRPWPMAFIRGPVQLQKRVENRDWKPPAALVGCHVALHSAKSWDESAREFIADVLGIEIPGRKDFPHSQIIAVCRLSGFVADLTARASLRDPTPDTLSAEQQGWYFGPYGWTLEDLVELPEPVPCKGALGLWRLPDNVLVEVREQYRKAVERSRNLAAAY